MLWQGGNGLPASHRKTAGGVAGGHGMGGRSACLEAESRPFDPAIDYHCCIPARWFVSTGAVVFLERTLAVRQSPSRSGHQGAG
jgi:hypothetical protein